MTCITRSVDQGWRDWLVDAAYFRAQPGGSFFLSWDTGWFASGTVDELEKPSKVTLDWTGKDAPAATKVAISLKPDGEKTHITLIHSGFGDGEAWDASREMVANGWEVGLENLESIFDTGTDLRITRRPMLGVMGNDFNEEIAASLGVPVTGGYRIADAIDAFRKAVSACPCYPMPYAGSESDRSCHYRRARPGRTPLLHPLQAVKVHSRPYTTHRAPETVGQ